MLILMGVSGSGKSTIGGLLAKRLGWDFQDADWFHPPENVEKMHAGVPLTDDDRWPWLRAIAQWMDEAHSKDLHAVIACSALKRRYRNILLQDRPYARLVYLKGEEALIARRLATRHEHFMPAALLKSQFDALEEPGPDEDPIIVSIESTPQAIVDKIIGALSTRENSS
jgi:gluconokinase